MRAPAGCAVCAAWLVACATTQRPAAPAASPERAPPPAATCGPAQVRVAQESLLDHVPSDAAFALVVRRNALDWLLAWIAEDPQLKAELGEHLQHNLGIDLTELRGLALIGYWDEQSFDYALYVNVPRGGALFGPALGEHRGVTLVEVHRPSRWLGAAVKDGIWIGHERAVRRAIDQALDARAPLVLSHDDADVDVIGLMSFDRLGTPASRALATSYGLRDVQLSVDAQRKLVLRVHGQDARVTQAKVAMNLGLESAVEHLRDQSRNGAARAPWSTAVAIVAYHHARRLAEALTPRVEGTTLVSEYQLGPLLESVPLTSIVTALAVPAVLEAMSSPVMPQALSEIERVAEALVAYHERARTTEDPGQSISKVATLRFERAPATMPCGNAVAWTDDDVALYREIGYAPLAPMRYALRVGPPIAFGRAGSPDAVLLIRAEGDVDCDGIPSQFDLMLRMDQEGNLVRAGAIEARHPEE